MLAQTHELGLVQLVRRTCCIPSPQPSPAGDAASSTERLRRVFLRAARAQREQHAIEGSLVADLETTPTALGRGRGGRNQGWSCLHRSLPTWRRDMDRRTCRLSASPSVGRVSHTDFARASPSSSRGALRPGDPMGAASHAPQSLALANPSQFHVVRRVLLGVCHLAEVRAAVTSDVE